METATDIGTTLWDHEVHGEGVQVLVVLHILILGLYLAFGLGLELLIAVAPVSFDIRLGFVAAVGRARMEDIRRVVCLHPCELRPAPHLPLRRCCFSGLLHWSC